MLLSYFKKLRGKWKTESSCIWTQDAATQEDLIQFHKKSSQATTWRKNAKYEHCQILKEHKELYKNKIGKVWNPKEESGVGTDKKVIDDWVKKQLFKLVRWEGNPKPNQSGHRIENSHL